MNLIRRIPTIVWVFIVTFVILGAGVWFFSRSSASDTKQMAEGTDLSLVPVNSPVEGTVEYKIESRQHIASGTSITAYNSNPPNSGSHWPAPAKNGVYDKQLPDEQLVHNLEHGHVWISYKPDTSEDVVNKLKEIVGEDDWKLVLEPRDKNDSQIALVSWGRVLKLDQLDENKVKDFIKTYRNRGPEKTPD